jgi:hypothetical protein
MKRLDTTKEAENIQLEIFRRMGPERRLRAALDLTQTSRRLLAAGVRSRHPDYTENQVKLATIKLTLGADLFASVYPRAKDLLP